MSKDFTWAIYVGRFQPFHLGHEACVKQALEVADRVLILVGSSNTSITPKNPFTFEEREFMIRSIYPDRDKVHIRPLNDYLYNDDYWVSQVQAITSQYFTDSESVCLIGDYSDSSSYYLKYFPQWEFIPSKSRLNLRATDVRKELFENGVPNSMLNPVIAKHLKDTYYVAPSGWSDKPSMYQEMVKEYNYIENYKKQWTNAPFPVQFITADATVICSGHVLVIERKFNPGKGLLAVPGGFVKPTESIERAALRELKEETGIKVDNIILQNSIERFKVFDHPDRSLRGRIVTHNFLIRLKDGKLPEVKANDDANKALWLPLNSVFKYERQFFEDHGSMLSHFILGAKQ